MLNDLSTGAKVIGGIVAAVALIIIIFVVMHFLGAPERAARAKAGQTLAEGRAAAGADAINTVTAGHDRDATTDQIAGRNADEISKAPGGDVHLDPGRAATGRRGLCQYAAYRDRPECLQQPAARPVVR